MNVQVNLVLLTLLSAATLTLTLRAAAFMQRRRPVARRTRT